MTFHFHKLWLSPIRCCLSSSLLYFVLSCLVTLGCDHHLSIVMFQTQKYTRHARKLQGFVLKSGTHQSHGVLSFLGSIWQFRWFSRNHFKVMRRFVYAHTWQSAVCAISLGTFGLADSLCIALATPLPCPTQSHRWKLASTEVHRAYGTSFSQWEVLGIRRAGAGSRTLTPCPLVLSCMQMAVAGGAGTLALQVLVQLPEHILSPAPSDLEVSRLLAGASPRGALRVPFTLVSHPLFSEHIVHAISSNLNPGLLSPWTLEMQQVAVS